ncbi:transmembrane protein, putative (macronuclear) [Tetrahymena thermophila SB210]|uniref:Transmembrane protein, putative n=1 Tax=Tetrahymena thermophila (strain SB210) TaxID=312017 RepID=W7XKD8_TETTS|nr:transmembrane protein, putative [Tetrahymena thermophila SB210]EWS74814.1 transmembrane protein, putative [Tetrahymena thermophila SB210]|eukprot:XP_012652645.1 transmembrane protein, putative [Tetrahymena thermophila SB210]
MYAKIFIFLYLILEFDKFAQAQTQAQDCCKCKDAPPPQPSLPNQPNQQDPCQCEVNFSYCILNGICIDLIEDIMWKNDIVAGQKKGTCFKTGDEVLKQNGKYDELKQSFLNGDIKLYPSACFIYEKHTFQTNQLFAHMIGKRNNYQMRTSDQICVDQSNFKDKANDISYCCIKGCQKQLCLDKSEQKKCVDLNQLQEEQYFDYQDQNVIQYKENILMQNKNKYIGQATSTQCLKFNEQLQVEFLSCFADTNNDVCIDQQSSTSYCLSITSKDNGPIGKTEDNQCVYKDKYYQKIKYCYQDSEIDYKTNYCKYQDLTRTIYQGQFLCVNLDENQFGDKIKGADINGNCITYDSDKYLTCAFGYCKILNKSYLSQCVKISLELDSKKQQNTISSYGFFRYCGSDDKEWAIACATGYCIPKLTSRQYDFYSDQTQRKYYSYYSQTKCVKMNNQYFGKIFTNICLNSYDPSSPQRVIECFGDYCIQTKSKGSNIFWLCAQLDNKDKSRQVKLQDQTCSSYDSQFIDKQNMSSMRCVSDFTNQSCLYQDSTSSLPKCMYFKQYTFQDASGNNISQPGLSSLNFIGRAFDGGNCQLYQDPLKSIYCDNTYCLNKESTCQPFDVFFVGKSLDTQCLEERDMKKEAVLCANTHCLSNNTKNPNQESDNSNSEDDTPPDESDFDSFGFRILQFVNKESETLKSNRILSSKKQNGGSKNKQDPKKGNQKNTYFCEKISIDNKIIGVEKQTGSCIYLGTSDQDAQYCIEGEYCLKVGPNGKKQCVPMVDDIICTDEKQNCLTIADAIKCKMCKKGQCLQVGNITQPCLNFNILGSSTCMAFDGTCQNFDSRNCRACPEGTCLDLRQRACIYTNQFKLKSNQCLKFKNVDVPCILYDLDNYNNDPKIQCTHPSGRCINMLEDKSVCQSCPRFYNQPGDNKCYGLKEQNEILNHDKDSSLTIFSLSINYIPINGCPQGCYLCVNSKWCTQCQDEYILYRNNDLKIQYCVLVNILNSQQETYELNFKTNQKQQIQIQCDINSLYPPGRQFVYKQDYFYCYHFIVKYQEGIIRSAKIFEETVILQLNNDQNTLQALQNDKQLISNKCLPGCITCQVKGSQSICLKCQDGFTLDFKINQCQKCPDQCLTCFYGGLYNLQTINWSVDQITLKSLDISKLSEEQYRLLCDQCEDNKRLVLKLDFSGCELCGDNCNICSWGNQNYNLTNLFDLNQALYSGAGFLKIKKCVQCIDGFIFNIDQISCVKKLYEDCLDEIFFESNTPLTKQNVIYEMRPFTTNQWFYTNPSYTYAQGCLVCNQQTSIITFQEGQNATLCTKLDQFIKDDLDSYFSYCKVPLLYIVYPTDNTSTLAIKPIYDIITCQECLQNYSFNFNTYKCNTFCKTQVYGCSKCYNYNSQSDTLFQCTVCENNQIPTQGGCQDCPEGCQSCFEGDYIVNLTRQLTIMRPQNSLLQRLNQLQGNDIGMICTSCTDSYYFDYNKKKCVSIQCGEFCLDCFQYKKQSKCLSCNKVSIMKRISSILGYITDFYFQQIIKNIDQMINYNEEHNDCYICPLSCKGCQYYKLTNNPLSLYSAKCLGCNQNIQGIKISDEYHWRYDQKNKKCLLCKKGDVGCYYEKKIEVYVACGSKEGAIGQGLMSSPYNLQRADEINWDKVIVNEVDFLRAVVIYNEIGLQKIDVKLNFIPSSSECQISQNIIIESNLMQKVFTLKEFVLTLQTFDPANPDKTDQRRKILLGRQIKFVGFTDINIQRIDWKLLLEDFKPTGFIFDTPYIRSVQIVNTTFSNPSGPNIFYQNLFDLQIFNLQQQLTIQNTNFTNFTYQNFELIKMYQKSYYEMKNQIDLQRFDETDNLNVTLDNLCIQNNTFKGSSFMRFSSQKIFLTFKDSLFFNNYLGQNSIFFILDQKINIAVISIWSDIMILKNLLESQFCFYVIQTFIRNEKRNIQFQENNITSTDIKLGIFQANKIWVQTLYLTKNTLNNQNIFTYLPQKQSKIMYDPEYEVFDKQWEPIIDEFYDQDNTLANSDKILIQLLDIYLQNNLMSRDGSLILELTGQTKKIGKVNLRGINLSCDNTLQQNQFQNMFSIKRIYQLYVDRMVICNNENSKFLLINDINIVNINTLDIKQQGDQSLNMRYPQILVENVNQYILLRNISMRKLLIQACLIKIITNNENLVSVNIQNFQAQDNQLSIFDQSEEVNLISITSHSFLNVIIRSSKLENNNLSSLKKIFKYSSNGILINSEQSKVTLKDVTANNNNALQGYSQFIIIANEVYIEDCSFVNSNFQQIDMSNFLAEIQGGAFYCQSQLLKISKCSFTQCFSQKGGAIYWQPRYDAVLRLNDSQFKNNIAQLENKYSEGGAIFIESGNQNQLDIQLNQVYADNNLSNQNGGFLSMSYSRRKVAVLINQSQLSNNFAINGGIINIDSATGSKGFLILDQVQIFYDLSIFAKTVQKIINNLNNIKLNELSQISFRNLKSVEFKEVSVTSSPQQSIDQNIFINQVLYQPLVQFQFFTSFFAVECVFQDIVVFQTFIEVVQANQIFIQQTKFLNIQRLKEYYLKSLQNEKNSEMTETLLKKQDYYLNIISDAKYYQQVKNSLVILDAINIIQINQSIFQKMVCPDCFLGPLFLTSQVATLTKNQFFNNQGKNGGAINIQYSQQKLMQQFQTKQRLLFEKQIVQSIKTYKMKNLELSIAFQNNLYSVSDFVNLRKARYLEEYKVIENSEIQQILIDNCQFQNNSAFNGGSIYAKNTYIKIQNSTLTNNLAEGYGGAIFNDDGEFDQIQNSILENKQEQKDQESSNNKILYNVEILSTLILYNQAKKVSGAFHSNIRYPNMNQYTTIYRNIANQYGPDIEVGPWKMQVMYKGEQLQKNSKIILESGYIQDELVIYLLGRRNEQFKYFTKISDEKEELEQVFLEISTTSNSQNVLIQPLKIEFNQGIFNLTKKLQIFGTFGSLIHVNLTCSKIKLPIYEVKTQKLIGMNDNYYFPLSFQISEQCLPGTKVQKQDGKYDICQTCYLKTYSLEYQSQTCHKCPISDAYCYKNIILIPQGYWRKNNQSSDISECRNKIENCLGDLNVTDQNLDSLKKTFSWQNNACAEGHIGAFCEDCDLKAQYWIKPYQRVNTYSCADCTQVTYNWVFVILSNAGQIALIAIVVFSSINYIKLKIYAEYLMKMKLFYFGSSFEERNKSNLYIKILINYFQIISCLSTFRIDIPSQINFLYKTVGNPLENVLYAQDCLLIQHFMSVDLIYYRLFVSHAQIVFFIICLFICLQIQSCIQKTKMNLSIIVCAINYCLYANLPSMVNLIIGTISCIQVGEDYYVKLFTSIECDSNHQKKQVMLLWPLLGLWAVVIPLLQFLILVIKRRSLHTISMKFSFGFLYNEYSENCFWWEIVKTFQKILIILVLNIYEQRVIVKGCIILAIVFMQMCFSLNQQPYLIPDLNKTDFISSIVCCLTISLGIILNNYHQSKASQIIIYILVAIINLAFIIFIAKKILSHFLLKTQKMLQPLIKKYQIAIDKMQLTYQRLKRLRIIIQKKIIYNKLQEHLQSENHIFNKKMFFKLKDIYKKFKNKLAKIQQKNDLQVKLQGKQFVKNTKKRISKKERRVSIGQKILGQGKQKKQSKTGFLDMTKFAIKTQIKQIQKSYIPPQVNQNLNSNLPSLQQISHMDSVQHSILNKDKLSQFNTQKQCQIKKEFQQSQATILNKNPSNEQPIQNEIFNLSSRESRENSIDVKRRCILSFNIINFTQGDILSFQRIKNLKYATYTEEQQSKAIFQQINQELDKLKQEYNNEQLVLQHLSFQKQELKDFYKKLSKNKQFSNLVCVLGNIQRYMNIEFNLY